MSVPVGDLHLEAQGRGEVRLESGSVGILAARLPTRRGSRGSRLLEAADQGLGVAHRQAPFNHLPGGRKDVGSPEQGTGMAGGQLGLCQHELDLGRQGEQAYGVGHVRTALAHGPGHLGLGAAILLDQPLVARSLLDRAQGFALDVLGDGRLELGEVRHRTDQGGNGVEPGPLGGQPAAFAGDQFVVILFEGVGPHEDRLEHAAVPDGLRQTFQLFLSEPGAGLALEPVDPVDGDFADAAGRRRWRRCRLSEEG